MGEDHTEAKRRLRDGCRALAREMEHSRGEVASRDACGRIARRPEFAAAAHVALYVPLAGEPDPAALAETARRTGKTVYYPRVADGGLEFVAGSPASFRPGRLGIPEPPPGPTLPAGADVLVVVPGLAFDLRGVRLGRGGGHYDRTLAGRDHPRVGIAFEHQILPLLPREPWDVPMNGVATEARWLSNEAMKET